MSEFHILIRVEAGPSIGMGHVRRCLSLADALRDGGATCHFLTNKDNSVRHRWVRDDFDVHEWNELSSNDEPNLQYTLDVASDHGCTAIVVDSYAIDERYLANLRAAGLFVVAVDDLARFPFPCQLVISTGAHAAELPYRSSSGDTRFLLGPKYALLRREFWRPRVRRVKDRVENVLITLGGADPHNLMPDLLRTVSKLPGDYTVTAFIGPFFENRAEIENAVSESRRQVELIHVPEAVQNFMLRADVAVSAGGQTLYELAAAGTPTVAVQVAQNQESQLRVLATKGILCLAGKAAEPCLLKRVSEAVSKLTGEHELLERMSAVGRKLVDGQGALKVAEAILQVRSSEGLGSRLQKR